MIRRAAVAAAVLAAAVGAAMALDGGRAPNPSDPPAGERRPPERITDERRIARVLEARAAALGGGGRPLAATSVGSQRRHDRRHSARARRIGVRAVRFRPAGVRVEGRRATARVELAYRLRGIAGRFTAARRLRLREVGGRWRVTAVAGRRRRPPWEVADFRRERSPHFVVLVPPGIDPVAGGLIGALETGYERMRDLVVRGELRRRYLVVVAADGAQARALTAGIRGVESLAALTDTEVRESGRARRVEAVAGQRLVVVWPAFAAAGPENGATVVVHELTHAVLAPSTSGRTPAWLTEGLALYVSGDRRVVEAASAGVRLADLSDPDAIARRRGEAQSAAYARSSAAAFYIAERYGRDRLLELYDSFNDASVKGPREAVRRVLGVSQARLERELDDWIASRPF